MKERPILFSAPMVRAILDGRKTQTRRIVKAKIHELEPCDQTEWNLPRFPKDHHCFRLSGGGHIAMLCPLGTPGDSLWVREAWRRPKVCESHRCVTTIRYEADGYQTSLKDPEKYTVFSDGDWGRLRPSIHMPRWASRLTLEIESIKVERLQDISEDDAAAEGVGQRARLPGLKPNSGPCSECGRAYHAHPGGSCYQTHYHNLTFRGTFAHLWESINGTGSWDANPWVWAVEFKRLSEER